MNRFFYQDQQHRASIWLKPIDLAWRRVAVVPATAGIAPARAPGAAVSSGPPPPTREEVAALLGEGEGAGGEAVDPVIQLLTQRMQEVEAEGDAATTAET